MATIGYTGTGNATANLGPGNTNATRGEATQNGWIHGINVHARADPSATQSTKDFRFALWNADLDLIYNGLMRSIGATFLWRSENIPAKRLAAGERFWMGYHTSINNDYYMQAKYNDSLPLVPFRTQDTNTNANPNPLGGPQFQGYPDSLYVDYQPNVAPLTPTWDTPLVNSTIVNQTPTFKGNMPQGADAAYDTIDRYSIEVYVFGTNTLVYGGPGVWHDTTGAERTAEQWTHTISGLSADVKYMAKFRTEDSWGVKSGYSAERTFFTSPGPNAPTPIGPLGKQNTLTPSYTATHTHPAATPLSTNAVQVIITNNAGTPLWDSGTITDSTAPGGTITATNAEVGAALEWAKNYQWKMRARDTAGNWGNYTALNAYRTNKPPSVPTGLTPSEGSITSSAVFTAHVSDPDGDPVTAAQINIVRVSTGVDVVATGAMTVNSTTGIATYTSGGLTLGNLYKYRVRATDGISTTPYGDWSDFVTFTYSSVPNVGMLAPTPARTNLVLQPSAEYDTTDLSAFWTVTATGTSTITQIEEDNAPYGAHVWEAVADGSGELKMETTDYITVDATKGYPFFVWSRLISGTPTSSFQVLCYNASSTLVGTLNPGNAAAQQLSAEVLPAAWTRYGGIVTDTAWAFTGTEFPATTTKVKLRFIAAASGTTGTVQFDAFSMGQLPYNPATVAERDAAERWFGYADGDFVGFDSGGYEWTGAIGDSPSQILSILDAATAASLVINYTHPAAQAKQNDRLIIQEWRNNDWEEVYDSNPTWAVANSNRTLIPLPNNVIQNETRYRLKVIVRDALLIEGDSGWVSFDTYYVGPAQLDIVIAEALPAKAQNRLVWQPSTLAPEEFAGYEIQRIDLSGEEPTVTLDPITDQSQTEAIDHYPAANREYRYRVRQLQIIGSDQVGGFWASTDLSCDYFPYSFLKDVANPELYSIFETEASNLVGSDEDAPNGVLSPWGAERPTVLQRWKLRIRTGQVVAAFLPEAGIGIADFPDADTRFDRAVRILHRRQTIAILTPAPEPEKRFVAIMGPARSTFPYPPLVRGVEFSWQEVSWSEDYYERMGLR